MTNNKNSFIGYVCKDCWGGYMSLDRGHSSGPFGSQMRIYKSESNARRYGSKYGFAHIVKIKIEVIDASNQ